MKIVLDDIVFSLQTCGGISGMFSKLIKGLQRAPGVELIVLEREEAKKNIFRKRVRLADSRIITMTGNLRADRYMPVASRHIPFDEPFIFHSSYYRYCTHPKAVNITTVHDFTYEVMKLYGWLPTMVHSFQKRMAIKHSRGIACVSNATRSDFNRLIGTIAGQIVDVIPNAALCLPHTKGKSKHMGKNGFFNRDILYVGARAYNKNFKLLVESLVDTDWRLVLCSSTLTPDEFSLIERCLQPGQWEIHVFPNDSLLSKMYSRCRCLVYPSSYEGFGIPIVEAQQHGLPVITGKCPASLEIGGGATVVLDEYTPAALRNALDKLNDEALYNDIIERGRVNASKYSWDKIVTSYLDLYDRSLSS